MSEILTNIAVGFLVMAVISTAIVTLVVALAAGYANRRERALIYVLRVLWLIVFAGVTGYVVQNS